MGYITAMETKIRGANQRETVHSIGATNRSPTLIRRNERRRLGFAGIIAVCLLLPARDYAQSFGTNFAQTALGAVRSSPAIGADGSIYIGSADFKLHGLRPGSTQQWAFATGDEIFATPAIGADGTIYVGSLDAKFYAVTPGGAKLWDFAAGGPIYSSAAIGAGGRIYFGSDDGKLYALNPDGTKQWAFATGARIPSSPAIGADGTVYFGSYDGKLYAVLPDGTKKWEFATLGSIFSSPAIGPDEVVYVGSLDNNLYALSSQGSNLWVFATQAPVYGSPAIGADGGIYFGSDDTKVYAIKPDGTKKWEFSTGGWIYSTPALATDGSLLIGSLDGKLYALNRANGSNLWQFATANQVFSSPVINLNGSVYFGSRDGYLYEMRGTNQPSASPWPMFRSNTRRTASGFVRRLLPTGYSPGRTLLVSLQVSPPATTTAYSVEDQPPAGWSIGEISDNGLFDNTNLRVKFGPFFDNGPRTLIYEVSPPLSQTGGVRFLGSSSADGWANAVGGAASLIFLPAHPADFNPVQGRITVTDLTAYGAAWKHGDVWSVGPNPIPIDYLNRAVTLWKGGEYYRYDSNVFAAPLWWVQSTLIVPPPGIAPMPTPYPSGTDGSTSLVDMSRVYLPGTPLTVRLTVTPAADRIVYAVADQPPAGWPVKNISSLGQWDLVTQTVKWGPFFDNQSRTFSYEVIPPANASGPVTFDGVASLDGTNLVFYGPRRTTDKPVPPSLTTISEVVSNAAQFTLQAETGFYYVIQTSTDLVNWTVLTNFFSGSDGTPLVDLDATNYPIRFYRALLP